MLFLFCLSLLILIPPTLSQSCDLGTSLTVSESSNEIFSSSFVTTVASETAIRARIFFNLNPFQDMYSSKCNPDSSMIEIEDDIASGEYDDLTDYDFHRDLQKAFLSVKDRHTMYIPPQDYSSWVFIQPFMIEKKSGGGIFVKSHKSLDQEAFAFYYKEANTNISFTLESLAALEGKEIIEINEMPVEEYLIQEAKKCTFSRDLGVCYNYVLKNFGIKSLVVDPFDDEITTPITYLFDDGSNETFEYVGICGGGDSENNIKSDWLATDIKKHYIKKIIEYYRSNNELESLEDPGYLSIETEWKPNTMLVKLYSLSSQNLLSFSNELGEKWSAITDDEMENTDNIVVDLRDVNGEGSMCGAFLFAKYLSRFAPKSMSPNVDMISDKLGGSLYCSVVSGGYYWSQLYSTSRTPVGYNWYTNGPERERNTTMDYTQMVHMQCGLSFSQLFQVGTNWWNNVPHNDKKIYPENLYFLTDGTCGGACGIFINLIKYLKLGRIITMGGNPGGNPAISSFHGAIPTSISKVLEVYSGTSLICQGLKGFGDLSSDQVITTAEWELYPWAPYEGVFDLTKSIAVTNNSATPLDYINRRGDYHFEVWSLRDDEILETIYSTFIEDSDFCFDGEVKYNSECTVEITNGLYGNPCESNTWGTDCVFKMCDEGYYYSDGTCQVMPDEYNIEGILILIIVGIIAIIVVIPIFLVSCCCCIILLCYCVKKTSKKVKTQKQKMKFRRVKKEIAENDKSSGSSAEMEDMATIPVSDDSDSSESIKKENDSDSDSD